MSGELHASNAASGTVFYGRLFDALSRIWTGAAYVTQSGSTFASSTKITMTDLETSGDIVGDVPAAALSEADRYEVRVRVGGAAAATDPIFWTDPVRKRTAATVYIAHDGNDATSGATLKAAIELATNRTVLVGPGLFEVGSATVPTGVTVRGAGIDVTELTFAGSNAASVSPGDRSLIEDLTLNEMVDGYLYYYAGASSRSFALRNVRLVSNNFEPIQLAASAACTFTLENVQAYCAAEWCMGVAGAAHRVWMKDVLLTTSDPNPDDPRGLSTGDSAIVVGVNVSVLPHVADLGHAIKAVGTSKIILSHSTLRGGAITATDTAEIHLADCEFNRSSVTGTVYDAFSPLMPTTSGRKLDVSTGGEAGMDWANVGTPSTTLNLSGTTVGTASALAPNAINASALAANAAAEIADAVWDEDLAGHAGVGSSGLVLTDAAASASTASGNAANAASNAQTAADNAASLLLRVPAASHTGTATAAGATTITLAVGASAINDFYKGHVISIDAGSTGANQHRIITGYVGATRVATVKAWDTTPTGAAYTIVGNTRPPNEESLLINASGHLGRVTLVDTATVLTEEISGAGTGDGDVTVNHDYGGDDELRVLSSTGQPVDAAVIRAYVASDYIAGTIDESPPATRTGSDGRWVNPLLLDADTYSLVVWNPVTKLSKTFSLTVT